MTDTAPIIMWFRADLRLGDNPALHAAADTGRPLIALYVLDETGPRSPGAASRWWLHHSLERLQRDLDAHGIRLVLRRGDAVEVLSELIDATGATGVFFSRAYEPGAVAQEQALKQRLGERVELRRRAGSLLFEPEQIASGSGKPYRVFTPFWKTCVAAAAPRAPLPAPERLSSPEGPAPASESLSSWQLLPSKPDWSGGIASAWMPGAQGAAHRVEVFIDEALNNYAADRDRPDLTGTSRLSPHLRFGEISPRQVWHAIDAQVDGIGKDAYLREIGWREFSYHLLFHWPGMPERPLRPEFEHFPWRDDAVALAAWQQGRTGYPIVDAGMRELWHTGWMHNRVRMVAASFLVKHLLLPWQAGERWFWDTLVDADPASNTAGWQWVAGCGADAAPFFRIFNPIRQGERFDPQGHYVRHWIPELAELPDAVVHRPWEAPPELRESAGIGAGYPLPLVEHGMARQRALDAFGQLSK
jgi:deoxyribodipyrimidine photo-lyase